MKNILTASLLAVMACPALADMETVQSEKSVAETMDALEQAVREAGASIFARVDHARGAASVGMEMNEAELLIFGNPKLGTPVMQMDPRAGLMLPLRVLVYQDDDGQVWLTYQEVEEMFDELDVDDDAEVLEKMEDALEALTKKAAA